MSTARNLFRLCILQSALLGAFSTAYATGYDNPGLPFVTADPSALDFGARYVGNAHPTFDVCFTNTGKDPVNISSIHIEGDAGQFQIQGGTLGAVLPAGQTKCVTIGTDVNCLGTACAELVICHDGAGSETRVPLTKFVRPKPTQGTLRLNAGGQPGDSTKWVPDYGYFCDVGPYKATPLLKIACADPANDEEIMYNSERWGYEDFGYDIPVGTAGFYAVTLHFAEIWWGVMDNAPDCNIGARLFSVFLEDELALDNLDIYAEVGRKKALKKDFWLCVDDCVVDIDFDVCADAAKISGIEIIGELDLPADERGHLSWKQKGVDFGKCIVGDWKTQTYVLKNEGDWPMTLSGPRVVGDQASAFAVDLKPGVTLDGKQCYEITVAFRPYKAGKAYAKLILSSTETDAVTIPLYGEGCKLPILRINAGGPLYTDSDNQTWLPDTYYVGACDIYVGNACVTCANDPTVYQSESSAKKLVYSIPVDNGYYDVKLHFAEIWWGSIENYTQYQAGKRVFDVKIEGDKVLNDFDIWDEVGPLHALVKTFTDIRVRDGKLTIYLESEADEAKLSAIEIIPRDSRYEPCPRPKWLFHFKKDWRGGWKCD